MGFWDMAACRYFYPRPPRGGRPCSSRKILSDGTISIHALREEGDLHDLMPEHFIMQFLSTPSARRATNLHAPVAVRVQISIHALREEGDSKNRDKISIFL